MAINSKTLLSCILVLILAVEFRAATAMPPRAIVTHVLQQDMNVYSPAVVPHMSVCDIPWLVARDTPVEYAVG